MELDHNQPAENGLREALAPWFDHSAAWLVLLCIGLTIFAALTGFTAGRMASARDAVHRRCRDARRDVRRLAHRHAARAEIRASQRLALARGRARRCNSPRPSPFRRRAHSALTRRCQMAAGLLQFAFFPFAAMAATGLLFSTRGKSFGPQFWLEATLVALCVGTVLWLALPHDLADGRAACARLLDRRARRRDRRARRAAPAAPRGLAGLARRSSPSRSRSAPCLARACWKRMPRRRGHAVGFSRVRCISSRSRPSLSPRISITCAANAARRRWTRRSAARPSRRSRPMRR